MSIQRVSNIVERAVSGDEDLSNLADEFIDELWSNPEDLVELLEHCREEVDKDDGSDPAKTFILLEMKGLLERMKQLPQFNL